MNSQQFLLVALALIASALAIPVDNEPIVFAVEAADRDVPYSANPDDDLELALAPLTEGLIELGASPDVESEANRFRRSADPAPEPIFGSPEPMSNKHTFRVRRVKLCYGYHC